MLSALILMGKLFSKKVNKGQKVLEIAEHVLCYFFTRPHAHRLTDSY